MDWSGKHPGPQRNKRNAKRLSGAGEAGPEGAGRQASEFGAAHPPQEDSSEFGSVQSTAYERSLGQHSQA